MESNDSPEIPDRGETSDIPGLPSGAKKQQTNKKTARKRERGREKRKRIKQETSDLVMFVSTAFPAGDYNCDAPTKIQFPLK